MTTLAKIKDAIRNKYAWPGGYPLYLVCADGEALSIDAARKRWREIVAAHLAKDDYFWPWRIIGVEINWEDNSLYCVDSGAQIESAYGEEDQ